MHTFLKYLVVDASRHAPHSHTVSEHDDAGAAKAACDRYNAEHGPKANVVIKRVQES
jgi:hypothetical protein